MAIHRKHLKDNGIKILSAKENIPETPEGVLLESLLEGMNQYYSEELSQKTKRGMRETRLKGNFIGGTINYGYSLQELTADINGKPVRTALKVIINEQEAPILLQIFTDYANGKRMCDIVKELHDKGILNRGKPFNPAAIYLMLQQEKYTGIYRIHGEAYDKIYPPIIPIDLFQVVKARIDANKYGKHVIGVDYILKGNVICANGQHKILKAAELNVDQSRNPISDYGFPINLFFIINLQSISAFTCNKRAKCATLFAIVKHGLFS